MPVFEVITDDQELFRYVLAVLVASTLWHRWKGASSYDPLIIIAVCLFKPAWLVLLSAFLWIGVNEMMVSIREYLH